MEVSEASNREKSAKSLQNWSESERRENKIPRRIITPMALFPGSKLHLFGCIVCTLYIYNQKAEEPKSVSCVATEPHSQASLLQNVNIEVVQAGPDIFSHVSSVKGREGVERP